MSLSNTFEFTPIPFSQWFSLNKSELEEKFKEGYGSDTKATSQDCERCDGYGAVECDLGQDHECDECEGSGKVEVTYEESLREYAGDQYSMQVTKDREKAKNYANS